MRVINKTKIFGAAFAAVAALGQAVLIAVVYAALDEWHQSWTDERFGSPLDVAIDSVGATVGAAFFAWLSRRKTGTTSP